MVEEKKVELAPGNSGISVKTIIIIAVVVIVIIAASIGITVMLLSGKSDTSKSESSELSESSDLEQSENNSSPAIYFLLKPDFVINFESEGKANFLSVQLEIMARDSSSINVIEAHMPVLRNNVLLLLSAQKYDAVRTSDGKNKLRSDILNIMKKIIDDQNNELKKEDPDGYHEIEHIEAVFFTGFIMQ